MESLHLPPRHPERGFREGRIEGAPHRQIHGEQIAVESLMPVGTFLREQDRDPEAGTGDNEPLDLVVDPGSRFARKPVREILLRPGIRPVEPVEEPEPAPAFDLADEFIGEPDGLPAGFFVLDPLVAVEPVEPLIDLSHLFAHRHPGEQILRPLFRGKGWILIREHIDLVSMCLIKSFLRFHFCSTRAGGQVRS